MQKRDNIKKRGVSPLIATVLIIGFTIVLAVIVLNWALPFVRNLQQQTEETSNIQLICAQDVVFSVISACDSGINLVKITVSNDGVKKIDKFIVRSYRSADDVEQDEISFNNISLNSFDIKPDTYNVDSEPIKRIDLIPAITVLGKPVTCVNNIRKFGSLESTGLGAC